MTRAIRIKCPKREAGDAKNAVRLEPCGNLILTILAVYCPTLLSSACLMKAYTDFGEGSK
jgi:hypothetical protein